MNNYDLTGFINVSKETLIENVIGYVIAREILNKDTYQKLYTTHTCKVISIRNKKDGSVKFYLKTI